MDIIKDKYNKVMSTFKEAKPEVVYLIGWSFPVLVSNVLNNVVYLIVNMAFAGKLSSNDLAAVSLGNTWTFCTSAFVVGSFNAMDTFISQAYGAKNYGLIGSTIQRAITTSLLFNVIITIIWIFTEPILILIHQDPEVSVLAQRYILGLIPGLWIGSALSILQKYLQAMGIMYPSIVCGVILNISNAILNFILVHGVSDAGGIGVIGGSISTSISKLFAVITLLLWIYKFKLYKDTWFGFSSKELFGVAGLKEYLKLGIPAGFQMLLEGSAFELLTILAGVISPISLDGHSIAMNFTLLTFMIPFSISIALSVRIGQLLGQREAQKAKSTTKIGFCITMSLCIFISLTQFLLRHQVGKFYSHEQEIIDLVARILPVSALFQFFDGFQTTCQGVIRGTGKNVVGAVVNFGGFYLVGIPSSCIFAFAVHKGVVGLWWGLCLGLFAVAVILGIVMLRINWEDEVRIAIKRSSTLNNIKLNGDDENTLGGGGDTYDGADIDNEFDRFNNEKTVETLGDAILLSNLNNNNNNNNDEYYNDNSNISTPNNYTRNNSDNEEHLEKQQSKNSSSYMKLKTNENENENYSVLNKGNDFNRNIDSDSDDDESKQYNGNSAILN